MIGQCVVIARQIIPFASSMKHHRGRDAFRRAYEIAFIFTISLLIRHDNELPAAISASACSTVPNIIVALFMHTCVMLRLL
jgi:hypothetical protein